ncbi:LysE family translocator [Pseudomonas syringae]|uniref:LysE family translocator n=1 Tax=Pseudomonas syringae TaxID=317 RepID=A0A9Q3X2B2_PSESX|nr:LysE family translocator [Pseudomonas syringae]MCF5062899.1 LysE family translocator [Pseudomonas syringae]MCF5072552.1 LysE family translocator [Pseudomonas syringae]MCF5118183.1 LysE family translocator [Pseudomonas syringae]MCF5378330.1 LysE family translocator [Pseudomonas syringae]
MDIFLYAFSVMYSPGPVNLMGLNAGLTGKLRRSSGFYIGVGSAMLLMFVLFGYTGEAIISQAALPYISLVGGLYTLYLAYQVFNARTVVDARSDEPRATLTFWNGLVIQLLNPKGIVAVLPITSVMLPAAHITGASIAGVSVLLGLGAVGAPWVYALLGALLGRRIHGASAFTVFNRGMGVALAGCAYFMFHAFYLHVAGP